MWFDLQEKNFVKHIENLSQRLSEKFIGDNLSITDIALRNWDLSIIGIAQSIFEIIDYRYRFSTERFIVPITDYSQLKIIVKRNILANLLFAVLTDTTANHKIFFS